MRQSYFIVLGSRLFVITSPPVEYHYSNEQWNEL
jgi:hypothetical protein